MLAKPEKKWSRGLPVHTTGNLTAYFRDKLPVRQHRLVPEEIEIYVEYNVDNELVEEFIQRTAQWLNNEFAFVEQRLEKFAEYDYDGVYELIGEIAQTKAQGWIIYYGREGGLDLSTFSGPQADCGVLPCATMNNHGVAWEMEAPDKYSTCLLTSRKRGEMWDFNSDVGHEVAHAAYAPIPLFGQAIENDFEIYTFDNALSLASASAGHLARLCYVLSEFTVSALRGEVRETESGFPLECRHEVMNALNLASHIFPKNGFDRICRDYASVSRIGQEDKILYDIGYSCLLSVRQISPYIAVPDINTCAKTMLM